MNKTLIPTLVAAGALVVPMAAVAKGQPDHPGQSGAAHAKTHGCKSHSVGYVVSGTLAAAATLTQTKGADTATDTSDDRYSGTLSVTVTRANHHAAGGTNPRSYTVADIRLSDGVTVTPPIGTRVRVVGKITKISKKCADQSGAGVVMPRKAILRVAAPVADAPVA